MSQRPPLSALLAFVAFVLASAVGAAAQDATCPYTLDNLSTMTEEDVNFVKQACDLGSAGDEETFCATCACAMGTNGLRPDEKAFEVSLELQKQAAAGTLTPDSPDLPQLRACYRLERDQYLKYGTFTEESFANVAKICDEPNSAGMQARIERMQGICPSIVVELDSSGRPVMSEGLIYGGSRIASTGSTSPSRDSVTASNTGSSGSTRSTPKPTSAAWMSASNRALVLLGALAAVIISCMM